MQSGATCQDHIKSVDFANFVHNFNRRFAIYGVFNEMSIHKALTLIFTYMARSQYEIEVSNGNIYYNILKGFNKSESENNCTILEIVTEVNFKGLYNVNELISIEPWLKFMAMGITDRNKNGDVVSFISFTKNSLCEPNITEKHSVSYDRQLKDPVTWQDTPSFFQFLQKTYLKPFQLCMEVTFKADFRNIQIRCLKHFKKSSKSGKYLLYVKGLQEIILTYTCYGFSCACLMVAIPLHACSLSWNTVAGKNVQCLMLSFLLSNIVFLFGIQNSDEGLCFWNSVFIHYFFLCDFSWMSVCFIHLAYKLYCLNLERNQNYGASWKTVLVLALAGFGVPVPIVATSVLLDKYGTTDTEVGYADDNICFPRRFPMNMFVFLGPVAFAMIINIICLIIVAVIVHHSDKRTNGSSTKPYHWYVPLFIRLSVVSGLSWAFGYLAEATGVTVFRYCFIVFGGLQGAMITWSFVFSGRNWTQLKLKLTKCNASGTNIS